MVVSAGTATFARFVVLTCIPAFVAAVMLGFASHSAPGSATFYLLTFAVAVLYFAVWALCRRRFGWAPIVTKSVHGSSTRSATRTVSGDALLGAITGVSLLVLFCLGALMVRFVPPLTAPVEELLSHARGGLLWLTALSTLVNGIAEELFFRGVSPASAPGTPWARIAFSVVLYTAVTLALGVALLAFAAVVLGVSAHLLTRKTNGLIAAMVLHTVWSQGMLLLLPALL